jgi:type IV pilus assembly protein PilA
MSIIINSSLITTWKKEIAMKKLNKGFTLVELMVVIVIIGILAAVAIPKFTVASHKAKASEFPTVLASIYSAEHTYQAENGSFHNSTSAAMLKDTLGCEIPTSTYFTYTCPGAAATFTATAGVKTAFGDAATSDNATMLNDGTKTATANLKKYATNWK